VHYGADAFAFVHPFKRLIDVLQLHGVGDEGIQRYFSFLDTLHVARQLVAAPHTSEGGSSPDASSHQLKRPGAQATAARERIMGLRHSVHQSSCVPESLDLFRGIEVSLDRRPLKQGEGHGFVTDSIALPKNIILTGVSSVLIVS